MADQKSAAKFVVGERVLCFEPNPAKARVLYDAKILDVDFVKDGRQRRESEYKVHFQGWNSAWDRWADETFVLKNNDENKKLQRKLARKAIQKMKNHGKKKVYLPGVSSSKLELNQDSSDSGEERTNIFEEFGDLAAFQKRARRVAPSPRPEPPLVEIPLSLQRRIEEDGAELVELPSNLSVVQILENFVKHFALCSGKAVKRNPTPEKSLQLCKETCEELRILFDFSLPLVLLYDCERGQYRQTIAHCYIAHHRFCSNPEDGEFPDANPAKRIKEDVPEENEEKRTKDLEGQKVHHRLTAEERATTETNSFPDRSSNDFQGHSNYFQGRRRSSRLSHSLQPATSPPLSPLSSSDPVPRGTPVSTATKLFLRPNHHEGEAESSDLRFNSNNPDQICLQSFLATDDVTKTQHISEAWNFRLLPENFRPPEGASVPCSMLYGVQHFLRLFVKLPEVFAAMEIPDHKLKVILKHIHRLLRFLADYEEEIFALSDSYVTNEL